jgi:tRNA (cytidine/uridine-2'-O-)-methyltransferase
VRQLDTRAQSGVSPHERADNIRGAFAIDDPDLVAGRHVGIVDDVMTSGSTLEELAATFKRFGAARVSNLVFARTPPRLYNGRLHARRISLFHVVLVEPEIPPNTGNVIRLCANTGAQLHLIEPLGFPLDDAKMRRAGLDYHDYATMKVHKNWEPSWPMPAGPVPHVRHDHPRLLALRRRQLQARRRVRVRRRIARPRSGLRESFPPAQRIRLPMMPGNRSLNLSNTVAVVVYEAWRQNGYAGGALIRQPFRHHEDRAPHRPGRQAAQHAIPHTASCHRSGDCRRGLPGEIVRD